MPDNPRQEVEIKLGERTFTVRPTFTLVANVEAAMGEGCVPLGLKVARANLPIGQFAVLLHAMLKDQKNAPSVDAVGEALFEDGMKPMLDPVSAFLLRALQGNKEHLKAAKEAGQADPPPKAE